MRQKYVITLFVSTMIVGACSEDASPQVTQGSQQSDQEADVPDPQPGPRHAENGVSYAALVGAEYEDELQSGIASSRSTLPNGVIFSVISSPDIVPAEHAMEVQLANARRGARDRGEIIADDDAPSRPFVIGDVPGKRIIYRLPNGRVTHTEVFTFEVARRTASVFVELADPPDQYETVVNTLTESLRVVIP
jgi:hypothetical protein